MTTKLPRPHVIKAVPPGQLSTGHHGPHSHGRAKRGGASSLTTVTPSTSTATPARQADPVVGGESFETTPRHIRAVPLYLQLKQNLQTGVPLFAADCFGLLLATLLSAAAEYLVWGGPLREFAVLQQGFAHGAVFISLYVLLGLYPGVGVNPVVELKHVTLGSLTATLALFAMDAAFLGIQVRPLAIVLMTGVFALVLVPVMRSWVRTLLGRGNWWGQPALVVGAGPSGQVLFESLKKNPTLGLRPVGILSTEEDALWHSEELESAHYLGMVHDAASIAAEHQALWALVALPDQPRESLTRTLDACQALPNVILVPGFEELPSLWNRAQDVGGVMGIHVRERLLCPSSQLWKRAVDVFTVTMGGLVLLPFFAVCCLLIKAISPGPAFYGHERIGRNGKKFKAWKFRTMVVNADKILDQYLEENEELRAEWEATQKLQSDPRIIRGVGHILRKTSLDELPQLWNVLRGEMSLVGPRPIVTDEIRKYGGVYSLYLRVTPGITGLWQISGRNLTTYEERVTLDAYYVRNWSPWLDLFILGRTVKTVLLREGAF